MASCGGNQVLRTASSASTGTHGPVLGQAASRRGLAVPEIAAGEKYLATHRAGRLAASPAETPFCTVPPADATDCYFFNQGDSVTVPITGAGNTSTDAVEDPANVGETLQSLVYGPTGFASAYKTTYSPSPIKDNASIP